MIPTEDHGITHRLVLEIEVPDFNFEGVQEALDEYPDIGIWDIITEEWIREDVGVTFVTIPGEKSQNSDFEVHSRVCRIVGARLVETNE